MKQSTRHILFWVGVALILVPTTLLVLFQPREYQASVFIEVAQAGHPKLAPPLIDRGTLYAILFLIGIYLPGVVLVFIAWRGWKKQRTLNGTPTI